MTASTLVEFLLARITEDKQVALSVQEVKPKSDSDVFTSLSAPTGTVEMSVHRVLADCEVKRCIVEAAAQTHDPEAAYGWQEGYSSGEWEMAQRVLQYLTLPYADHPDYRPEWRP